ncbi:copper chaperone PCu(A)C [Aquihabitans daechungensis]|uniref:copper chaperone PCu(A)C n=1 Tax=Aquihabitans daechungensis TaxID=1052257 RepID=UPI003BA10D62
MTPALRSPFAAIALSTFLLVGAAACGSGDGATSASAQGTEPATVHVDDATIDWPANPSVAAVRMLVRNGTDTDDRLLTVSSPVAEASSIHRTDTDDQGRSTMERQDGVAVPARSTVTFESGGLHVMLTDLDVDLHVGDQVTLNLTFEQAGTVQAQAEVVEPGSAGDDSEGNHDH